MYELATTGSEDEKIAVASILSGASLFRGWSIQVCLSFKFFFCDLHFLESFILCTAHFSIATSSFSYV